MFLHSNPAVRATAHAHRPEIIKNKQRGAGSGILTGLPANVNVQ